MINSITLVGRLTDKPTFRTTQSGVNNASFTIALNAGKDTSYFFKVVVWKELAERVNQFLDKGSLIGVSGILTQRKYTDKNNQQREAIEIVANSIEFLSPKKEEKDEFDDIINQLEEPKLEEKKSVTSQEVYDNGDFDDRLPF